METITSNFIYYNRITNLSFGVYIPDRQPVSDYPIHDFTKLKNNPAYKKITGSNQSIVVTPKQVSIFTKIHEEQNCYFELTIYNYSIYDEFLENTKFSDDSCICIIDNNNNTVASMNKTIPELSVTEIKEKTANSTSKFVIFKHDGKKKIALLTSLNSLGWRIMQIIPYQDASVEFVAYLYYLVTISLSLLVFLSLLSVWFSRRISQPIISFADTISHFHRGSQKIDESNDYFYEVNQLQIGYNSMVDDINKLLSDIKKSEREKYHLNIKLLQSQINIHFLCNTLNSLRWSANEAKAYEVGDSITSISRLLRMSLDFEENHWSINHEIEYITLYMNVQKKHYDDCFIYMIDCPNELSGYIIPKMILQPFVENSIKHGFAHMDLGGFIKITISEKDGFLNILISDNGCGLTDDSAIPDSGYGISNSRKRIMQFYGENYKLLYKNTDPGLEVTIMLPILKEGENENVFNDDN